MNRNLLLILVGQAFSQFGDWLAYIALPMIVLAKTGSPLLTSLSLMFELVPALVVGPLAGPLVDRWDRRTVMMASDLARGGLLLAMFATGRVSVLFGLVFIVGVVSQFFNPALAASIPNIVAEEQLLASNALRQGVATAAMIAGPPVGGAIVAWLGARQAFALDAFSFFFSAALLALTRIPATRSETAPSPLLTAAAEGLAYVRQTPPVLGLILIINGVVTGASALNALEPVYAKEVLRGAEATFGMMVGAWGLGMFAASLGLGRATRWLSRRELFLLGGLGQGAAILMLAAWPRLPFVLAMLVVGGIGNAIVSILLSTILQRLVPDQVRGRVFTLCFASIQTVQILSMGLWGALAQWMDLRILLAAAGLLTLLIYPAGKRRWAFRDGMLQQHPGAESSA